jgi:Pyruvate/2-oxoacid:ferredoxin oxidoreductase gamma subunit
MIVKTIFSGFGGQGVLMMGISLANSAMNKGYCLGAGLSDCDEFAFPVYISKQSKCRRKYFY